MGYYVYDSDDLKSTLNEIQESLDTSCNYLCDVVDYITDLESDYDYYNGETFYEDLYLEEDFKNIVDKINELDKKLDEAKKEWNERIQILKDNAEDRFQDFYENAIIEVKK